eukprot:Gb_40754 [translate_table: standard]
METLRVFPGLYQRIHYSLQTNSNSQTSTLHRPLSELNRRLLAAAVSISFVSSFPATHALAEPLCSPPLVHPIQHLHIKDQTWFQPEFECREAIHVHDSFETRASLEPNNAGRNVIREDQFARSIDSDKETAKTPMVMNHNQGTIAESNEDGAPRVISASLSGVSGTSDIVVTASLAGTEAVAKTGGTAVLSLHQTLMRVLQHLGGGGVAGVVGATIMYPLDTIKTRMQAQSSKNGEEPEYEDELDCFRQLVVNEGPASLYSGLIPQLLGIAPEKALKLTVNEVLLNMLEHAMPGARIWALEFIAGGGGGFSQVVVTNPMEIVKVRLQTQSKEGAPKNLWAVVKELGLQGLYNGSGITLARDVPSSAVFFACYTLLQQLYPDQSFLDGCIAAIPATILVTPFDVIKTRLQMEPAPGEEPYTNAWHCLKCLWQREGARALYKGNLARVLRTSPQFGITLLVYSLICEGQ